MELSAGNQSLYKAGLETLRQNEARRRAMLTNAAGRSGMAGTGVEAAAGDEITKSAQNNEQQLYADIAGRQQDFENRKELLNLQASLNEAAAARQRALERKRNKSAGLSKLIGAGAGALAGALLLPGLGTAAGAELGSNLGSSLSEASQ